jgi:hypothetical protein
MTHDPKMVERVIAAFDHVIPEWVPVVVRERYAKAALEASHHAELVETLEGIVHFGDAVAHREDPLAKALREYINAGESLLAKIGGVA